MKVLPLLIELITSKLKLTEDDSFFRHVAKAIVRQLTHLARSILAIQRREEEARATLTDVDLRGRDVITLICETQVIDLLENKYV